MSRRFNKTREFLLPASIFTSPFLTASILIFWLCLALGMKPFWLTIGLPNTVGTAGFIVCLVGVPALGVVLCIRLWRQKGIRAEFLGQIAFPLLWNVWALAFMFWAVTRRFWFGLGRGGDSDSLKLTQAAFPEGRTCRALN